jgi:hypothetical protein
MVCRVSKITIARPRIFLRICFVRPIRPPTNLRTMGLSQV